MIKAKKGICIDCPPGSPEKNLIAKRCQTHYWPYRSKVANQKKIASQSNLVGNNKPKQPSKKTVCLPFASPFACKQWYLLQISLCKWVCENCKIQLFPYSDLIKFSCQAHILPKEHFPSVKLHIDNHLTLGVSDCSCHKRWDNSWTSAKKMNVFPLARQKVAKLIPFLTPKELSRLPEIFQDLIEIK